MSTCIAKIKYTLLLAILISKLKEFQCIDKPDKVTLEAWELCSQGMRPNLILECVDPPSSGKSWFEDSLNRIERTIETSQTKFGMRGDGKLLTDMVDSIESKIFQHLAPLITALEKLNANFDVLWVVNMIVIRGATVEQVKIISDSPIVKLIRVEEVIKINPPSQGVPPPLNKNSAWNIELIKARCEAINCSTEAKVIVGIIDTGVLWNHTELIGNWVGPPYGWLDASNNSSNDEYPKDRHGHGTHVAAIATGRTVGVAPNTFWTACCAGPNGSFAESALQKCGEFMACPWMSNDTKLVKTTKNCSKRAHVINNSWGGNGCDLFPSTSSFYKLIQYWNSWGIVPVFAIGNSGPACGSGGKPGCFDIVTAVGAVDKTATVAYFSSRGPIVMAQNFTKNSTATGSCIYSPTVCALPCMEKAPICIYVKPDVVAPGVNIYSAWNNDTKGYNFLSGTSMASPHVAGAVALIICSHPNIKWNNKIAHKILTQTTNTDLIQSGVETGSVNDATAFISNILCNVLLGYCNGNYPNNDYGYGLINVCEAVKAALEISNQ